MPAPDLIAAKLADVIANMRGWAVAARMAADAFERADTTQRRPLPAPVTRPTVAQAEAWNPDALRRTADDWDAAAADLQTRVDAVVAHDRRQP